MYLGREGGTQVLNSSSENHEVGCVLESAWDIRYSVHNLSRCVEITFNMVH